MSDKCLLILSVEIIWISDGFAKLINIGKIHYHKENKTNGGKQIEFSAESNQFEKNQKWE